MGAKCWHLSENCRKKCLRRFRFSKNNKNSCQDRPQSSITSSCFSFLFSITLFFCERNHSISSHYLASLQSSLASVVKGKIIATNSRTANRRYTNIRYVLLCSPSVRQMLPIITVSFLCKTVQKPFLCGLIITHFCFCHYFF